MLRTFATILVALALLLQPMLSLGQSDCECCEVPGQDSMTPASDTPVSDCCAGGGSTRPFGGNDAPTDREEDDGRHTCPASCCLGLAPVGLLSSDWTAPPAPDPGSWGQPTSDRYVSAPASGLTKPPRPVRLV
ncbi:MAG: hypothetical protein ACIARR_13275 [Phycisphaerales bacterium JB059]